MPDPEGLPARLIFEAYGPAVAYISVEKPDGKFGIGTGFHIGDDVFITARHVVEGNHIQKIATTHAGISTEPDGSYSAAHLGHAATQVEGPYYHPDERCDLAAVKAYGINAPSIRLLPVSLDHFGNEFLLASVVTMGFPPIPGTLEPVLVCAKAEVNAAIDSYLNKRRLYVISCLARGGFSGAPVVVNSRRCMGVVTQAMVTDGKPEELGFMSVISTLPILELLDHHAIMPDEVRRELWEPYQRTNPTSSRSGAP